jgi:hypothetical protein
MIDLPTSLGYEDQWGKEAWYLAHQIEEAVMCTLVCVIVTNVYVVT